MRQVVVYPGEDGYWVVECPSLPGCISQGKTKKEAIENIKEAIRGNISALEEDGLPILKEHVNSEHRHFPEDESQSPCLERNLLEVKLYAKKLHR